MNRFFQYKLDHVLFWALTIFFHGYTRLALIETAGTEQFLLEILVRNILLAGVIYITILFIIPNLVSGKKVTSSIVILFFIIALYVLLKGAHDVYRYTHINNWEIERTGLFFTQSLYNFSIVLFYLAFASAMHLSKQWYLQREHIRKIELEKLNTELEYLKAQINPHFLFNSLNTVFFKIDKQNIQARETLAMFSDMLRYQLYECNGHEVPVEKEVSYLKNYADLQRLRRDENYDIRFSVSNDLANFTLPPLLLLPFVENAFKHVSDFADRKNEIKIDLRKSGNLFQLNVRNTKDTRQSPDNGGIGLKNVKRRLELLYNNHHRLDIIEKPENFEVNLEIQLSTTQP
ncbi:MAG: histidine kinase [Cyclobacteriaceae bacterium]|nr:histidine kinase [Cyclobacteriaceae bacterium]